MNSLVSIIIPVYNRSNLIGATLDSILAQTYPNWECIVVDDSSTDYTVELLEFYGKKDKRFRILQRPKNRLKGANACRNFGFEKSTGNYIQWFDSDDLMVPEFLEIKVAAIEKHNIDFVISKSANFKDPNPDDIISRNERYYRFNEFAITNYNYIAQKINWLTYDFLGKRELCTKVEFNEKLPSGQEYNFFCKLTHFSTNAFVLDKYLTKRRVHNSSIRHRLNRNEEILKKENLILNLETWKDMMLLKPSSKEEKYFLFRLLDLNKNGLSPFHVQKYIFKKLFYNRRFLAFFKVFLYLYIYKTTGKGYVLRRFF